MPSQEQIDSEATQSDLAARVAELEAWKDLMVRNILGPAQFRSGLLRFGANDMQLDNFGTQVLMPTTGLVRTGIYFVKSLYGNAEDFTRGDQQSSLASGYSSTTSFSTWATYFNRDSILSGPFSYITLYGRSSGNGSPSAEILLAADYDGSGNAAELRIKEDSSGNLTYKIHKGSGVYQDLGSGGTWIAFPI